jgi:hypothetical protein
MKIKNSFLHSGNSGDILASLPAIREFYRKTGIKPILYLRKGVEAFYYEGAVHPIKDAETGKNVMLNDAMIKMLTPLLKTQPWLEDVREWKDEEIGCDLDQIRETYVGMPGMSINRWYFYVYPDLACDLTKEWLVIPDAEKDLAKGKVIITRTERYTNPNIDYSFLKPYEDELVFSGTMREYNVFCMNYDLNIRKLTITNFLELAQAIKQSRFHMSNQTMAFQISTGSLHPRILEVCSFAQNVIVFGEDAYDFQAQVGLEYYFHLLYGDLPAHMEKVKAAQKERPTSK